MINTKTGNIEFNFNLVVKPKMDFLELDNLSKEIEKEYSDMKTGWEWLRLKKIKTEQSEIYALFGFENGKLKNINFCFERKHKEWSEKSEIAIKNKNDLWLNGEIGKERNFEWGFVESVYDSKN